MKKLGIHSVIRKRKIKYNTTKPEETDENKLARNFYVAAPNQKWATDVWNLRFLKQEKSYTSVQSWIFMIDIRLPMLLVAEMIIS